MVDLVYRVTKRPKRGNMTERGGELLLKLSFVFSCVLIAVALLLTLFSAGTNTTSSGFDSLGDTVQDNVAYLDQTISDGFGAVATTFDNIAAFTARATDIHALIRPADYSEVPVITALPAVQAAYNPKVQPASTTATPPPAAPAAPIASIHTANLYTRGNCTWWAATRRAQINKPIPNSWGNAATWAQRAARDGYAVDHTPTIGAIMQTPNSARGLGHVAFVEKVDPDGTWHISEMNVIGLGKVSRNAMPAAAAARYNFIH